MRWLAMLLRSMGRSVLAFFEAPLLNAYVASLRSERDSLEEQVNAATEALRIVKAELREARGE